MADVEKNYGASGMAIHKKPLYGLPQIICNIRQPAIFSPMDFSHGYFHCKVSHRL